MKRMLLIVTVSLMPAAATLTAQTMTGQATGTVISVDVEAAADTAVIYASHGETPGSFRPFPFDGSWSFAWIGGKVDFTGVIRFGDYQTITNAGSMGGVTRQVFYGFSHRLAGSGRWDSASRTFTFEVVPEIRDDERASTVEQSRPPECVKVSGMFAGKACSAFMESSPGLEGIKLTFRFTEDRRSFEGEAELIQYSGRGVTESEATVKTTIRGELSPR